MRSLWVPKKGSLEEEWEDGFAYDEATGRAAIADGASSAMGAASWARCLCEGWTDDPPGALDSEQLGPWLSRRQGAWSPPESTQSSSDDAWWADATTARGSWATLAMFTVADSSDGWLIEAGAIGDTCLFLIHEGVLSAALPELEPDDFGTHPELVGTPPQSVARTVGALETKDFEAVDGDLLLGATDALAEWALRTATTHAEVWETLATVDAETLVELVCQERAAGRMINDDVALLRCRFGVV